MNKNSFYFQLSYGAVANLCRSIKLSCELYPSRELVLCLDPYNGLGLVLWCIIRFVFHE